MKGPHIERLASAITAPKGGVVGMVDEVLSICRESGLNLDWQTGGCRAWDGRSWEDVPGSALRKSVFRAALARFAVLCDARPGDEVSPYGGEGEIAVGMPATILHVTITNTTAEQSLRLGSVAARPAFPVTSPAPAALPAERG